ncbi:MAG: hypothetical protein NUW02_02900 [Candidatus Campbellbacteria bacterium]|nr:hypothetical protein [Candidatus Campbellbacteria bacterium]
MSSLSKKTKIIIGIIVLVIIIGGVKFFARGQAGPFSGTMFDLFDRGGKWKCTWEQKTSDLNAQGNIFISGKKFKSETISSSGSITLAAQALSDGEFFYAWTSLAPIGIRTDLSELKKEAQKNTPQTGELGKDYTFDCQPWKVDDAAFTIPMDIVFSPVPPQE